MRAARLREEAQKLRNDVAAAELVSALRASSIRTILLKGPAFARWLYNENESRTYWDIDLLVSPAELACAESVVHTLGFTRLAADSTRIGRNSHHERWYRADDAVWVELHRGFVGVEASDERFWNELSLRTEGLPLRAGVVAEIPDATARTMLVALHAANHGPIGTALEDLVRAVHRVPEREWRRAAELANRVRAEGAFRVGLSLIPEGRELAARLELAAAPSREEVLRSSLPPLTAMGFERLMRSHGLVGKLRYLASELAPPHTVLIRTDPLARHGKTGIAAAYLLRPARLVIRAPRGFRAWRAANRRAAGWPRGPDPLARQGSESDLVHARPKLAGDE